MHRIASSLMALAIGLAPASGALAADDTHDTTSISTSSEASLSLDLLSLTDFVSNPTDDTWLSVIQQLRAHPCFNIVGEEGDMCKSRFGLTADIETMLGRTDFVAWLRNDMIDAACGGMIGTDRSTCVASIPMLTGAEFGVSLSDESGIDLTTSNEVLFERAGTAPTTRQNAIAIIDANANADVELTPHERSMRLWDACEDSSMGQNACYQTFIRYVGDRSVDIEAVEDVIRMNR